MKFILKMLDFLLVFTCKLKKIGYNIIGNNVCYIKLLRSDFYEKVFTKENVSGFNFIYGF